MIKTYIMDCRLFEDQAVFSQALELISPYRRQKAALLRHENDKKRSLAASFALNAALKAYDLEERMMEYDIGKQGKPFFRDYPDICFSLSHSGDYAICSIGDQDIGNDIERIREGKEQVAERFFTGEELSWIADAGTVRERDERIFRVWTMKESFLKVTGCGMALPLTDFAVITQAGAVRSVRQQVNDKTYYLREYDMPPSFREANEYKISLCSESKEFAEALITAVLPDGIEI